MSAVDWSRYRQCPVCFVAAGKACQRMTGIGPGGPVAIVADRPHGGRPLRTGTAIR